MSALLTLSRSGLRQAIASHLATVLGADGWRQSTYPASSLAAGIAADPRSVAHRSFAVAVGRTSPIGDRQRRSEGTHAASLVSVRSLHRIRGSAQVEDHDAALDDGEALIRAVMSTPGTLGLSVHLDEVDAPESVGEGTYALVSSRYLVQHRLALE